jgi:uncharacterized phage protein (TIGR01671 family)
MRELKFRAWYGKKFNYFSLGETNKYPSNVMAFPVNQYTGLKDKNGKEIYEGDVLEYRDGTDYAHFKIYWNEKDARFYDTRIEDGDSQTGYDGFNFFTDCKIIGNIHENPELL